MTAPTTPKAAGFHCSGECWREAGMAPALIKALEEASPHLRDWFAYGEWASEESVCSWALPPQDSVHATQDFFNPLQLSRYLMGMKGSPQAKGHFYERYPTLLRWQGKYFIFQGTHRLAALYQRGAETYTGWLLDLDKLIHSGEPAI